MLHLRTGPILIRKNIGARLKPLPRVTVAMARSRPLNMRRPMLKRTLTALAIAAVGLPAIIYGGVFFYFVIGTFLVGGGWGKAPLFRPVQVEAHEILTVGGVLLIATTRFFFFHFET